VTTLSELALHTQGNSELSVAHLALQNLRRPDDGSDPPQTGKVNTLAPHGLIRVIQFSTLCNLQFSSFDKPLATNRRATAILNSYERSSIQ